MSLHVPQRTLAQWLELQEQVHSRAIDLGLGRVGEVAARLRLTPPPYKVVTVAGTNGKGSTVEDITALLMACGCVVGTLTSPHLLRYNERVRIDAREATDHELISVFEHIEAARGEITLTFFEYNLLAALLLFADRKVDVAVLEVGLGGRLDATNVVDADVGVLVSVGFDHRDWLGDTLDDIGREKAGIFRKRRPAVLGTPQMPQSVLQTIAALDARPVVAERDFSWEVLPSGEWHYRGLNASLSGLPPPALAGEIQYRNAATALAAVEALLPGQLPEPGIIGAALRSVQLPGRFQVLPGAVEWILDVSHNEPAAAVLAANLRARPVSGRTIAVCGILMDKDAAAVGREMAGRADLWITCTLPGARGCTAAELAQRLAAQIRVDEQADSVAAGCERARSLARPGDRVLVFGSFTTVTAAMEWLRL